MKEQKWTFCAILAIIGIAAVACDSGNGINNGNVTVSLDKNIMTLEVGITETLVANVNPNDTALLWTSSDETKAVVNNNGRITGISPGKVKITVATVDGCQTAECVVTVNSVYILGTNGYWVDGVKVDIDGALLGLAVSEGKVYTSGYYRIGYPSDTYPDDGIYRKACYWLDGNRIDLPDETGNSCATRMTVSNGKVYIAGWYNDGNYIRACYWEDGQKVDLPVGTGNSMVTDITVINNIVYAVGCYGKLNIAGIIIDNGYVINCYWVNGTRYDLNFSPDSPIDYIGYPQNNISDYSRGFRLAVSDGKVYTSGNLYGRHPSGGYMMTQSKYYINRVSYHLASGSSVSYVGGITVSNNKVYVAGQFYLDWTSGVSRGTYSYACYWIDQERINLSLGEAISIAVSGNKTYISGMYKESRSNSEWKPCFWVNGERRELVGGKGGRITHSSSGIVVVSE